MTEREKRPVSEAKLTKGVLPPTRSALLARIRAIKQAHSKSKTKLGFTDRES